MAIAFEYEDDELVDSYEFGEAECPECGYPVVVHFKNGVLVGTELCTACIERT